MAQVVAISDLKIQDIITFITYGTNTVPNVVNGKVLAFESGQYLRNPNQAAINHANIFASLPVSAPIVPNDYTKYDYILIELVDSAIVEIGIPWINPSSVTRLVRSTATIIISDYDSTQSTDIINYLNFKGFTNISIQVT